MTNPDREELVKRPVAFRVRQHRLSNYYELYTDEKDAQFWAENRGIEYEGLYLVADRYLAPPADAGMREALGVELSDIFERFLSAHDGDKAHLADVLREWLWDNKAGLVAALTAPGATTKSDGGEPLAGKVPCHCHDDVSRRLCTDKSRCYSIEAQSALSDTRPADVTVTPRVIDNDRDEIVVTLNGNELRGWSYSTEQERRVKMLCAREFVEGFYAGRQP